MTFFNPEFITLPAIPKDRTLVLTDQERAEIEVVISSLRDRFSTIETPDFAMTCEIAALQLPKRVLAVLKQIAAGAVQCGHFLVRGFQIDDAAIGPSPAHWDQPWEGRPYLREEIFQMLISGVIGGAFGWRTQENGRFLRHIVPIDAVKNEQLGGSSATTLLWHTEEAFHPGRADFFTLMCYRNREQATTNIASIDDFRLGADTLEILRQPRFIILPDKSHTPVENSSDLWALNSATFERIARMMNDPQPVSLIYGPKTMPMMRVDQAFVEPLAGDSAATDALVALHTELDRVKLELQMQPGDIVLLDNLRVAHGRSVYTPDYGPKHRWMRRVNIANGRRHSFDLRDNQNLRVML
jgi:Fe(II)/alpha-ketoglutarate-dependent arginine beta-hydroxylase